MGDGFRFVALVAEAVLMLVYLMQISIAKRDSGYDDIGVSR